MHVSSFHYFPLAPLFVLGLTILLVALVALLQLGILGYAYEKMGLSRRWACGLLVASLLGSCVNIPIAELGGGRKVPQQEFKLYGVHHAVPAEAEWPGTMLALNVGGAIIPLGLSIFLMAKNVLFTRGAIGTLVVALVVHAMAEPVEGHGIAVPIFVPPLVAAVVGMLLSRRFAAPLAYVSGSLGTLVGADLMNLHRLAELGAPIASIGGAGTFDGIFLTGILAVLLAH